MEESAGLTYISGQKFGPTATSVGVSSFREELRSGMVLEVFVMVKMQKQLAFYAECLLPLIVSLNGLGCSDQQPSRGHLVPPNSDCHSDADCEYSQTCVNKLCIDNIDWGSSGTSSGAGGNGIVDEVLCRSLSDGHIVCGQKENPIPNPGKMKRTGVAGGLPPSPDEPLPSPPQPPWGLPSSAMVNLNGFIMPNQGNCGSCVAFAVRNAMGILDIGQRSMFDDFSPAHIWYIAGYGANDCQFGSWIDVVINSNIDKGIHVVSTSTWPYSPANPQASLGAIPTDFVLEQAGIAHINSAYTINPGDLSAIKAAIANGFPPVIAVPVYWNDGWLSDGNIHRPAPMEPLNAYHAVALTSYNDTTQLVGFANSWGSSWGQNGFGTMTYDFIKLDSGGGMVVSGLSYKGCSSSADCPSSGDPNGIATCNSGVCGFSCLAGFEVCGTICSNNLGSACNTGTPGICSIGTIACSGGSLICMQNELAATETCDGFDNNCNGQIDEGNPGGGAACNPGGNMCQIGVASCSSGALVCTFMGNASAGTGCGANAICNGAGTCCNSAVGTHGQVQASQSAVGLYQFHSVWCSIPWNIPEQCVQGRYTYSQEIADEYCLSVGSNNSCYDNDAQWSVTCSAMVDCVYDCNGICVPTDC